MYHIESIEEKKPDLSDKQTREEILQLVYQKNNFDYNRELLEKITNKKFTEEDFVKMGKDLMETTKINSIKDNKKFEINAVEVLYSLLLNAFTLINDEKGNIYLAKIKKFSNNSDNNNFEEYVEKQNSKNRNTILRSYDLLLNKKYNVVLNQKTIERVKNFFQ